jgi:ubiquitin carboxyl-terminal hydrolase L3
MNDLAHQLGLSSKLEFYDIFSLDDPEISNIPRPVHAILAIIPMTPTWEKARAAEDKVGDKAAASPAIWFKQTIPHACGMIGLLHCLFNGPAAAELQPGSVLHKLRQSAIPLSRQERSALLEQCDELYQANEVAAVRGDTAAPNLETATRLGQHFVAFVKGDDGHLWELEGCRNGPWDRGALDEDEDTLSCRAINLGVGKLIAEEQATGGDLRFSCIALAPSQEASRKE